MIAKKLFFTIVALGILFLPFSVVAADKNTMWQQLIEQEGCLLSSPDINYTISGSVFEKKLWKNFLNYAQNNKAVFYSIVNKFGSRKATKLHICNFRNATEGEVAVFVVQRIAEKNWYSYDGNNDKLKVIAQKKVAAKVLLLKNVIEDKEMCKELQFFFKQQYNLKNKISRENANNKASTILSCWQEASSGKTFLVFYHNYYIIIYSNLHSEYMKPKQKIKYQKKGNVVISASYPSLPLISIKNAYTLEQKWIPAGVVTYKRISMQVLDSNLKTWKIADLDISNLPDSSPPKLIK